MLTGGIVDIIWYFLKGGIFNVYELVRRLLIISCLVIFVVSQFTKCPSVSKQYDEAQTIEIN